MNKITTLALLLMSPLGCTDDDHSGSDRDSKSRAHSKHSNAWTADFAEQIEALRIARDFSEEGLLLSRDHLNRLVTTNRKCIYGSTEYIEVTFHDPDKLGCIGPYGPNIKYDFPHFYRLTVDARAGEVAWINIMHNKM